MQGHHILTFNNFSYPEFLKEIRFCYLNGSKSGLQTPNIRDPVEIMNVKGRQSFFHSPISTNPCLFLFSRYFANLHPSFKCKIKEDIYDDAGSCHTIYMMIQFIFPVWQAQLMYYPGKQPTASAKQQL